MHHAIDVEDGGTREAVAFEPGTGYHLLGWIAALFLGLPSLFLVPVAPVAAVPGLALAAVVVAWTRGERAWADPEGVWIRRMPLLADEFVGWDEIAELALPMGSLRSPWMWLHRRARVRLPLFVDSEAFADAVAAFAPDVLARTSEVILHTSDPRGRWIEGVWHCDVHRRQWCGPCSHRPAELSL